MDTRTLAAFVRIAVAGFTLWSGLQVAHAQVGVPDYYAKPNYAVSKLPTATCRGPDGLVISPAVACSKDKDCPGYLPAIVVGAQTYPGGATCSGPVTAGGIRKFVDTLPVLCSAAGVAADTLGKCIPVAVPDTATFPGDDYYELGVKEYTTRFHSDLANPAKQRGFYQINTADPFANQNQFLGPLIIGTSYRPVRMKFVNQLPIGPAGDLNLPVDVSLPGVGDGPDGTRYTQNRIAIHLHGGNSPWISDGTQHQWTVPAGEATALKKGMAVAYVPDMWFDAAGAVIPSCAKQMTCAIPGASTNPGDGQLSFYWPNEQSGRLMFYHDHAYGITRLNVMAGVAAGYLLVNPPDEDALAAAGVPGTVGTTPDLAHLIPLIIQDRTFVPPQAQLDFYDSTWDAAKWGGEDSVYLPHVYTPNQWLGNPDGSATNPMGRWDYGPFFWPPQQTLTSLDGLPRPLTVDCTTMAGVAPGGAPMATQCPSTPNPSLVPETFLDTPVINGTAYPKLAVDPTRYRFQILNAANDRYWNLSLFLASTPIDPATGLSDPSWPVNTEVKMVKADAAYLPNVSYTGLGAPPVMCDPLAPLSEVTGLPIQPVGGCTPARWPTDSRVGGVPDPAAAGPRWVQIGTEAGILPGVAVSSPLPVVYEMNKRSIVVTNVLDHSLFVGPAERADVVVDFSAYAGQTLILYSDSPAPVPAGDPKTDYFTWGPDFSDAGGAPSSLPGYGPNTRTLMQITVNAVAAAPIPAAQAAPLDNAQVALIDAALKARFPVSQLRPIVPQKVFSDMYTNGVDPTPVTIAADTHLPISVQSLTFTPVGTATPVTMPFQWKALHELFSTDYGRMNSLLAVEIPMTNWLGQTTIPYSNVDPATEFISDNVPALWKITHNGVDTHVIHFHLMNVQIINRVGWDGQIRAPDANELGWKESVRMNQLEDIYIALQPVKQHLPWPQPDMVRPLDVDRPLGTLTQFTGVDIYGNPINVTNQLFNFGQEYVWHCHLLGHEENDMLRAEVFVVAPEDPSALSGILKRVGGTVQADFAWTDNSMSAMTFTVQRDTTAGFAAPTSFIVPKGAVQPGQVTFTDPGPLVLGTTYFYRARAEKALTSMAIPGATWTEVSGWTATASPVASPLAQLLPPSSAFAAQLVNTQSATRAMTLTNVGLAAMTVGTITLAGANAADFVIVSTTCGATLAVNASCNINVAFKPLTVGAKAADLTVPTNSAINPTQTVALTGTGVQPEAVLSGTALVFGGQAVNTTSLAKAVTLLNRGGATLTITSVTITGTNANNFSRVNGAGNCGATLAVGASCNLFVTFRPSATGARTGTLVIASNDPTNPTLTVTLSGTGLFAAATGVTLTPSLTSPRLAGTVVTFTAAGSGAGGGAVYSYRFWLFDGLTWTLVQDYSTVATWTWNNPTALPGTYTVTVDVRTNPSVTLDATRSISYTLLPVPPATGVTLTPSRTSPRPVNTAITWTAAGSGAGGGVTYSYQYWLFNGTSWTMVRDWSTTATWAWTPTVAGAYQVQVLVRTSPLVTFDTLRTVNYTIN